MSSVPSPQAPVPSPNSQIAAGYLPGLFEPLQPSPLGVLAWACDNFAARKRAERHRPAGLNVTLNDVALADRYCQAVYGHALRFCDLCDAFAEDFFAWHMQQPRVHSPATGNRSRASLLSVWRDAARRGLCYPPRHVRKAKVDKRLPDAWSEEQVGRILAAARDCPWQWDRPKFGMAAREWSPPPVDASLWLLTVIATLYWTGLRKNALLSTPVRNLDLAAGGLLVPAAVQKQRSDQWFELPHDVCGFWSDLDVHGRGLARLGDDWPYDRHENSRWKTLNRWYARLLTMAGLVERGTSTRRLLWHKLRRTFATYIYREHGIGEAQRLLGHSSPQVTAGYIDPRFHKGASAVRSLPTPHLPPPDVIPLRRAE